MKKDFRSYSDEKLVQLICRKKGSSGEAFKVIYDRYSSNVHAYCAKILGDPDTTEDIFQETFIKFYNNVKKEHTKSNIHGFLITIARNLCLNYKRNKKTTVDITEMDFVKYDTQNYEQTQLLELINTAVDLLEDEYKDPFVMREYNGMSYKEISEQLDISETNAKTRVFRAKNKIKEILEPYLKELVNN